MSAEQNYLGTTWDYWKPIYCSVSGEGINMMNARTYFSLKCCASDYLTGSLPYQHERNVRKRNFVFPSERNTHNIVAKLGYWTVLYSPAKSSQRAFSNEPAISFFLKGTVPHNKKNLYYSFDCDENLHTYVNLKKWGNCHKLISIFFTENELFTENVKKGVRGKDPNGQTVQFSLLILTPIKTEFCSLQNYRDFFSNFILVFEL